MRKRTPSLIFSLATLGGLAACSSDRTSAPAGTVLTDAQVSADLAVSGGRATAADLQDRDEYLVGAGVLADHTGDPPLPHADGSAPSSSTPAPTCSYSTTTGRWTCAPFTNSRGLTITQSYEFFDATGAPMQHFSGTNTAKINYQTEKHGPVGDGAKFTGITHRTGNQTTSGLLGIETTRVWDGAGVSVDTNTYRDSVTVRHYAGVRLDTVKALTFAHPRLPGAYPLSGQTVQVANYTVTSTGKSTETRSVSRRVVTAYNGTALAKIQSGNTMCTLHLDTGKVDDCHSS